MTVIKRYSTTIQGALYQIGNSLGLYINSSTGIGNLTTATPAPPSGGTTTNFLLDSNSVNIQIPSTGTVYYAEITWICASSTPTQTISPATAINNSIFIKDPKGVTSTIAINPATTQTGGTIAPGQFASYTQSTSITSIIQSGGNGFYTVSQVPMVIGNAGGGYTITIIYQDNTLPFRNMTIWSLRDGPALGSTLTVPITGFSTPTSGNVTGRLTVGALAGNPEQGGDFLRFGPTAASAVTLSGPNNQANNFFASQINNNAGILDTTGTWGNSNATPGTAPPVGARAYYDTTNVNASAGLTNNQTSAVIVLGTTSDAYGVSSLALQLDVNSARLTPISKVSNNYFATINDTITYTVTFGNSGLVAANNVVFVDTIPDGMNFVSGSVIIDGTPQTSLNPNPPGFSLSDISPNSSVTISFKAIVTTIPSPNPTENQATLGYTFVSAPGLDPITASDASNIVPTKINYVDVASSKQVNKAFANIGDILTYTISISTIGSTSATNIIFSDTIPNGASFVSGSLTQNSAPLVGNPNPPGVPLNNISTPGITTVSFKVKVDTIPFPNPIPNSSVVTYSYIIDPTLARNGSGSSNTNIVYTQINNASLGGITKIVDKDFADCNDIITYTIVVPNSGNVTALNVIFKDTIPNGTVLVANSVKINNVVQTGANPTTGISVPNIAPGTTTTITFSVQIQC